jgi:hypothetical protein
MSSDEGRRAAVHDRNFGTVDFDDGVIDAHAAQGSEHVLGGGNQRAFAVAENGSKVGGGHGFREGGNFAIGLIKAVRTKIKPASTGAGPSVRLTGKPE